MFDASVFLLSRPMNQSLNRHVSAPRAGHRIRFLAYRSVHPREIQIQRKVISLKSEPIAKLPPKHRTTYVTMLDETITKEKDAKANHR